MSEEIHAWSSVIEKLIRFGHVRCIDRVMVLGETASTQDAARKLCAGKPGLMVVAGRQTAGRGRLGRVWADTSHSGAAVSFVLDGAGHEAPWLSIRAGLAACATAEAFLAKHGSRVGVRWPNDVVERREDGRAGRKLAGVLIEAAERLFIVGIGINVRQENDDWPETLRARAVSLLECGADVARLDVIERLMLALDSTLRLRAEDVLRAWKTHDVLTGSLQTFEHDSKRITGIVEGIEPMGALRVKTRDGNTIHLPALTTSLVHE